MTLANTKEIELLLKDNPNHARAYEWRAVWRPDEEAREAVSDLTRALELVPGQARLLLLRGQRTFDLLGIECLELLPGHGD